MRTKILKKFFSGLLVLIISVCSLAPEVYAYDNPDLLPDHPTPVIDLARALSKNQRKELERSLNQFEDDTGWKLRVLTQYEKTPGLAVRKFWNLDERSLLLIADPRGGNLLNFNVGDAFYALMPRLFWVELQTRFGNQYYVREKGEDAAIIDSLNAVELCLERGGCEFVPGLSKELSLLTLASTILGGLIAGFASSPRKDKEIISIPWLLLFSPLWIMLSGIFGIAPVITRTNELIPLARNGLSFFVAMLAGYLLVQTIFRDNKEEANDGPA